MGQEGTALTGDKAKMITRAEALIPELRGRRHEADDLRRLPNATVADLRELGIAETMTPTELGGFGLGADALFEISVVLGRGCGSTAWCGGNYGIHNHLLSSFPIEAQEEVFAGENRPLMATGFSPLRAETREKGDGAVVSGSWDFSSGIESSDWVLVFAMTAGGPLAHLLPTDEIEIMDTWFTLGLRGSGSKDIVIKDKYVPPHRLLRISEVAEPAGLTRAHALYGLPYARLPLFSHLGAGVIGTIIGTAQGGVEVFTEQTAQKIGGLSGKRGSERSDIHARLGKSIGDVEAATAVASQCYDEMGAVGAADRDATVEERVKWRSQLSWAVRMAHGSIERLFQAGGANSLRASDQFGQFYRDCTAGSHHYGVQADTYETARGRLALGLDHGVIAL